EAKNLTGGTSKMLPNHHITKPVFIGEIKANGQFDVVWKTPGLVAGDAWSKELDGSKDLVGDWVGKKCGNFNTKTNKCLRSGSCSGPDAQLPDRRRRRSRRLLHPFLPGSFTVPANLSARLCSLLLSLFLIAFALPAFAGPFEDAVAKFANDDYSDTEEAIGVVASSGNKLAFPIIGALQDGRLMADPDSKKVYVTGLDGKSIDAAVGSLTLQSPDIGTRLQAAQSVFKSHEETALEAVDGALAKETSKSVKAALGDARAAILLFKSDASEIEKLEAVATLKARGDQEAMALLTGMGDQPASVTKAAASAIGSIQSSLAVWSTVQNAWYGLSLGSVLLLAAIGLAITFGVMGVINMAHGEMVMIGAYTTFVVQETIRTRYPVLF
ncbi:MAG: transporter substrate-binding protein, partial [Bradyrhizobium sp.]|nr:transporter substrate-binding protein [Bradyrhizobium sp.]